MGDVGNNGKVCLGIIFAFSILWGIFGTGNTGVIGEIFFGFILLFCAEYNLEVGKSKLPILAWIMTAVFIIAILSGKQVLDTVLHIGLLWCLYGIRKAEN